MKYGVFGRFLLGGRDVFTAGFWLAFGFMSEFVFRGVYLNWRKIFVGEIDERIIALVRR